MRIFSIYIFSILFSINFYPQISSYSFYNELIPFDHSTKKTRVKIMDNSFLANNIIIEKIINQT